MKRKLIFSISIGFMLFNAMAVNAIWIQMFSNRQFSNGLDDWTYLDVRYVGYGEINSVTSSSCEGTIKQDTNNAAVSTFMTLQIQVRTFGQNNHPDCGYQSTGLVVFKVYYTNGQQSDIPRTVTEYSFTWKSISRAELIPGLTIDYVKFHLDNLLVTSTSYLLYIY